MKNMENAEGAETTDKVRKTGKLDEKLLPPDKLVLPKASTPQNQNKLNMKILLVEILIVAVIAVIVIVMAVNGKGRNPDMKGYYYRGRWHPIGFAGIDLYGFIMLILMCIGLGVMRVIPGTIADFSTRPGKEKRGELESIRRNNYAKHLCRLIEIDKTEILDNMRDRFNPVVQILFSEAQAECLNRSRACNHLMVRLGLGSVDISDHVVVQEAGGKREREVQLTDVANEVKIKTAVIHDLPVVLDLSRTGVIGIVSDGNKKSAFDIARNIIGQLEINETNDRIQLAFACDPGDGEWVGYDELYLADRKNGEISFAAGEADVKGLLDMLANELQKRNGTLDYFVNSENVGGYRHIVLFVDDPGLLEGHLINRYILPGEENLDFTVVVLSDDEEKFILEMDCEIIQNDDFAGIYKPGTEEWIEIKFDRVTEARLWSLDEIVRKNSERMVQDELRRISRCKESIQDR